ncbi:MAG: arylamine N-acetyltransferase [Anaerolineae bacterium]|nr:arylamine N-acetyltransferase [Anaerolineae bacterium]MCI0610618.1 arylamine N-acetyltransferase [Anaerolineae bacterium]
MDIPAYLNRMHYSKPIKPDAETLRGLQIAHMMNIPFENLDIVLKRSIHLSEEALWEKIIVRNRGGFCYELNGLFAWLLKQIGFDVTYLNARVFNHRDGKLGIEFDHLALMVKIPNGSARWLVDAGFGDSFNEPLNFEDLGEQVQGAALSGEAVSKGLRSYRLEQTTDGYITWQKNYDNSWERQYFFDLQPRRFPDDYEAGCLYHQTSPRSSFTRSSIISRATSDGRVSLEDGRLIITTNGQRAERPIANAEEYQALLKEYFGVVV